MNNELLKKVKRGEISFHEIDKTLDTNASIELRRKAVAELTGTTFNHISNYSLMLKTSPNAILKT